MYFSSMNRRITYYDDLSCLTTQRHEDLSEVEVWNTG